MNDIDAPLGILLVFLFTSIIALMVLFGWVLAHQTVSTECQRLGAFYVGDKTFECKEKK